ncbi:MAG: hypothetical protein PWP23_1346 [Candidatus Sumerlaeota bacterium]|nr:hypothetical protein [Candidatus Sumerlaeota bacterium]
MVKRPGTLRSEANLILSGVQTDFNRVSGSVGLAATSVWRRKYSHPDFDWDSEWVYTEKSGAEVDPIDTLEKLKNSLHGFNHRILKACREESLSVSISIIAWHDRSHYNTHIPLRLVRWIASLEAKLIVDHVFMGDQD